MDPFVRGAVVLMLALSACGDDETADAASTTTETTATTVETTTTTEPPPDPSVIPEDPADIDEEYIEAVLRELFHLDGEILRIARQDGASPELADRLQTIYEGDVATAQLQSLADAVASDFEGYADPPGDIAVQVVDVVHASLTCVAADTVQDATAVGPAGLTGVPVRVELRPATGGGSFNTTAWVITVSQPAPDEETSPCAG